MQEQKTKRARNLGSNTPSWGLFTQAVIKHLQPSQICLQFKIH